MSVLADPTIESGTRRAMISRLANYWESSGPAAFGGTWESWFSGFTDSELRIQYQIAFGMACQC